MTFSPAPADHGIRSGGGSDPTIWTALLDRPFHQEWCQAGEWHTRYLRAGERGEPLLLLHGTGGHAEAYARNLGPLSRRFDVIAPDFAGHGLTTHAGRDLEIDDYVDQVIDLLDALGLDRVHIAGESLGGWVAARLAARHPGRVARLVLNTPGGTMATPQVMGTIRRLSQEAADDPTPDRIRTRLEWLMADPSSVTDELVEIRRAIYSRLGFADSIRHVLCLQDPDVRRRNLLTDDVLRAVAAETLVIWTSDDPSGPAATGQRIAQTVPLGQLRVIDRAGHWPQWERADEFNRLVIRFLTTGDPGPGEPDHPHPPREESP